MSNISIEDSEIVRRALLWLSNARWLLTIEELAEAVIVELDDTELDREARLRTNVDVIYACGSIRCKI